MNEQSERAHAPTEGSEAGTSVTKPTDRGAPETGAALLAVFADRETAEAVRRRLEERGLGPSDVRVGLPEDEVTSLRGEMHQELTEGFVMPQAGVIGTRESMGGAVTMAVACSALALVVAVPLAFVDLGASLGVRLVLAVVIAVLVGSTVGFIAGSAAAARRPDEASAAQRGAVVRVASDAVEVRDLLVAAHPLRVDRVVGDRPVATLWTEQDEPASDTLVDEMRANAGSDDFSSPRHPERSSDTGTGPGGESPGH